MDDQIRGNIKEKNFENIRVVYEQYSENWRHYDDLIWQVQSIAVALNGFLITQVFGESLTKAAEIRAILMFVASFFTFILWIALIKHILHQGAQSHNIRELREQLGVKTKWFIFSHSKSKDKRRNKEIEKEIEKDIELAIGPTPKLIKLVAGQKAHQWLIFVMGFISIADFVMFMGIVIRMW
jgi:hypothetical protein